MGLADLHMHTIYSYDGTATVPDVLRRAHKVGLDVIAITDHDVIEGALAEGYVSVTPLQLDLTAYRTLSDLNNWNLQEKNS